ncbi:HDOD domain-containing protein [Undibacterium sp. Ji22W]|uniref:HDOD domain-containing protein n=1 Tax=Undibacterium sp. Ji22W TaxID=3413038 RepID=UPI003BF0022A
MINNTQSIHGARERLLEKIRSDKNLPTLGVAINKVVQITSSGEDSVSELAHFILSDVALTQKILHLSNTITYRTLGGVSVTTISRAIFLLGFDTIKASALATLLVDGFRDQKQAQSVRKELVQALCASVTAREIARHNRHPKSEEAAVAALFKNIGRILVASFDHLLYDKIQVLSKEDSQNAIGVCNELLGCSFERFGESVLQDWKIPDSIILALQPIYGEPKKSTQDSEWVKQVANLSEAVASILVQSDSKLSVKERCAPLIKRFGNALDFNAEQLEIILKSVDKEARQLAITLEVPLARIDQAASAGVVKDSDFCNEFMLPSFDTQRLQSIERHPSGKPTNARDLLLAGVQDATQMLASKELKLNDLVLLVLETLYAAMGFRFATACLRDLQQAKYSARISVGEKYMERQKEFQFSAQADNSIFHVAMNNNVDLMITDALNPKIQAILPSWHKHLLPDTRSFIVLPLIIDKKALGLFYADRIYPADEGMPPDETALIKTLKGQLLSAMTKR